MGAVHYAKDSGNFGCNLNGKFRSVSSDRNIRDHLWRWSTNFGRNIFRTKFAVPNLTTGSFPSLGNSEKEFKMSRAISIG